MAGNKIRNLNGLKFGNLKVLSCFGKTRHYYSWNCECLLCGKIVVMPVHYLTSVGYTDCGCIAKQKHLKNLAKDVFYSYKKHAKTRNLKFKLSFEHFYELTIQNCFYCDTPPANTRKKQNTKHVFVYNGIDRVNNKLGYIHNNVVSCCKFCNIAKSKFKLAEFITWLEQVARYRSKLNVNAIKS